MTVAELWEYACRYNLQDRDLQFLNCTIDNVEHYDSDSIYLEGECYEDL